MGCPRPTVTSRATATWTTPAKTNTVALRRGAARADDLAPARGAERALLLKERSPSCGAHGVFTTAWRGP